MSVEQLLGNTYLIVGLFACVVFVILALVGTATKRFEARTSDTPYRAIPSLMTSAELRFFTALVEANKGQHWLFSKVRLADLMTPTPGLKASPRQSAFNKIKAKHIDFVLCSPETLKPVLAIELDDASHRRKARRQRDAFLDRAAQAADLALIHVSTQRDYDIAQLRAVITKQIHSGPKDVTRHNQPEPQGGAAWLRYGEDTSKG